MLGNRSIETEFLDFFSNENFRNHGPTVNFNWLEIGIDIDTKSAPDQTGDAGLMEAIWSDTDDVSNLGPFEERNLGAEAVRGQFRGEADLALGGQVVVTDLHIVDLGDVGYSTGVENGTGHTGPDGQPMELRHRFTNIFRRESGGWRIVHHHTDRSV